MAKIKLNKTTNRRPVNKLNLLTTAIKLFFITVLMVLLVDNFPSQQTKDLLSFITRSNTPKTHDNIALNSESFSIDPKLVKYEIIPRESRLHPDALVESAAISVDHRVEILRNYLSQYNSPLTEHANDFIEAADIYDLDWKLVAAIAGVESTFGKFIPGGHDPATTSYNGWGWGVYGNNVKKFLSWREGIFTVSKGLREGYINKGLNTPYQMNTIYAASPTWGAKVTHFLDAIQEYAERYNQEESLALNQPVKQTRTLQHIEPDK